MGTAGEGESRLREQLSRMSRQQSGEGKPGAAGWRGAGPEGQEDRRDTHPALLALGPGTPCQILSYCRRIRGSPCGRCLHGQGKKTHQQLFQKRQGRGGVAHLSGSGFSPSKAPPERGSFTSGVLSPSTSKVLNTPR